jgi:hypothetical protein
MIQPQQEVLSAIEAEQKATPAFLQFVVEREGARRKTVETADQP